MTDAALRVPDADRWNHNLHYSRLVLDAVPPGSRTALDVGCGEGTLTRALRRAVPQVTGLDPDAPSIERARAQDDPDAPIDYVQGGLLTTPLPSGSFDVVVAVASLHHMDAEAGLRAVADVLAPGGVLVVVGCARSSLPRDVGWEAAGVIANAWHRGRRSYWEHSAPTVWPPPVTHADVRRLTRDLLPGARYRRHVLWRYSLVWTKPTAAR
jgi:SAM-dependent methyltransferase